MFINKLTQPKTDIGKMVSYLNVLLKTEITCIPKILTKYFGDYYNNAVCNGATWIFVIWCILHGIFDAFLEALLKRLRYREFVRARLKSSLWYLGFYGTGLVYCGATLSQNEVELFNFKRMHVPAVSNLPTQVILGYTLICMFYLHSAFWEGLIKGSRLNVIKYFALFLFLISSYILRIVEVSFTFTALISVGQVALEVTRSIFMSSTHDTFVSKFLATAVYMVTFATYFSVYLIVVPLTFVVPLGLKIMSDYPDMMLMFLFLNLLIWMGSEIYQSILLKFINHWLYHKEEKGKDDNSTDTLNTLDIPKCDMSLLECSLFKPRDDISYHIRKLRKEMQERKSKMMAMRKPKNMLYQTLKCMVAVKRKLTEKRIFDSLKSTNSDDNPIVNEDDNATDDDSEKLSDQEDESDDEASESQEDDKQVEKSENVRSDDCEEVDQTQNNSSESQVTDSESEHVEFVRHEDELESGDEKESHEDETESDEEKQSGDSVNENKLLSND